MVDSLHEKACSLVADVQRRTTSRSSAWQLSCVEIDALGLGGDETMALLVEAYRQLFPEHNLLAGEGVDTNA